MLSYSLKRLAAAILTILLIAAITFTLMNAIPGSPFLTDKSTPQQIAAAEEKYGLDKPLPIQFANYIGGYLHGDMGTSLKMQEGTPVTAIIFGQGKFQLSIKIGITSLLFAVIIGIPLGCIAAYFRGSWIDSTLRVITTLGVAIPGFVIASLLLLLFAVRLGVLDVVSGGLTSVKSMIMPVLTVAIYPTCYISKLTRTTMLDSINQDYIRTARAKGLNTKTILFKHALRNSLIPVITYLGPLTAGIITGSFVAETTFAVPGLGKYFVSCILNRDYPLIMATTVVLASLVIIMNLVVDIVYKFVDPRITLTTKEE